MTENSARQELAFIKQIMEETQKSLIDNGKIYMLWSLLAVLAVILKLAKDALDIPLHNLAIYLPILLTGWILSRFLKKRVDRQIAVKKFTNTILEGIWKGFAAALLILVIVGYITGGVPASAVPPVIAALIGTTHYASGIVLQNKPIRYSAFGWWLGAVVMFVRPGAYALPLLGLMLLVLQLLPAVLLYNKWKTEIKAGRS